MGGSRLRWHIALAATLLAATPAAVAAPQVFEWAAPPGCPDGALVQSRVEQLSGMAAAAWPATFAVRGRVVRERATWRISLSFDRESGPWRVLEGETCAAVSEAAALHIALGLEVLAPAAVSVEIEAPRPAAHRQKGSVALEVSLGVIRPVQDDFDAVFMRSGYAKNDDVREHLSLALVAALTRRVSLVGSLSTLAGQDYILPAGPDQRLEPSQYHWQAFSAGVHARFQMPFHGGRVVPFLQGGGGLVLAGDRWNTDEGVSVHAGGHLRLGSGLSMQISDHVDVLTELGYILAPVTFGDGGLHDSGGLVFTVGGRAVFDRGDGD